VQRYRVGWLVVLVVLAPIAGVGGGGVAIDDTTGLVAADGDAATNTTEISHQHPDGAVDDGDPTQIAAHVDEELSELLRISAERLEDRDYAGAAAPLGPEYERLVTQYEAAGGTAATTFNTTGLSQREAVALAQEYESTRDRYTTALATDDD